MSTICFPFAGNLVGGSHISACELIRRLDRSRFQPLVLLQHGSGEIATLFAAAGVAFEIAPSTVELDHDARVRASQAFRLAAAAPRLARYLRSRGVDIVHCNDGRTLATWAIAAKLAGARLLWHHRGSPNALGLRLLAPVVADRVAAVSSFAAPRRGFYSAAARTRVIHSPFDAETAHDRVSARKAVLDLLPGIGPETRVIAFAGAFIDRKRPLLFVDAIATARAQAPDLDIRGVMFGSAPGAMLTRAERRAHYLGIDGAICFAGYRTPGAFWLAGCEVLMVPAIDEPFGRTLIESMLAGTAVVATASGGNLEAIEHDRTGLLTPPEDAEALADACLLLLADPVRRERIAAQALTDARARFGEAAHVAAVTALYDELQPRGTAPDAETIARARRVVEEAV